MARLSEHEAFVHPDCEITATTFGRYVRGEVIALTKTLRHRQTAAMRKPQCGDGQAVECLLWAE